MSGQDEPRRRAALPRARSTSPPVPLDDDAPRRELLALAITAAGIGTFEWDLVDGTLSWDDRLIELFGYETTTFDRSIAGFNARVHPDDLARVTDELQAAIACCGEFASEYRVSLPGGQARWVGARGRVLSDEDGSPVRMLGAAWDVTAHREGEARITRVLESMATAFFSLDHSWRFTYVNAEAERILGRTREELVGGVVWDLFPAARDSEFEVQYRRAMDSGETTTFDAYYPAPLDSWYEVRAWRTPDGLSVYFLDVTERRHVQELAAQAARRARLLGRITEELVGTLDAEEASRRLAGLVVPVLADWCIVTLVGDAPHTDARRALRGVASRHTDPRRQPLLEEYSRTRLASLTDDAVVVRALESGQPQLIHSGACGAVSGMLQPGAQRDAMDALAPEAVAVLPLAGRGGPVGILSLANGAERGDFTEEDLVTATHVAARAGLVLDNARLYRQQRDLAEGLQRSLLTAPPEADHVEVVVRYTPAAQAAQVGGDWYDAFVQPGGSTVLVIGDVVGHDVQAAAAMGQVRTLLRGIGAVDRYSPAEVLHRVDQVMETLQVGTTATAVVARLEQDAGERGTMRLRWSNAGHPPPLVVDAEGIVLALTGASSDLLLGVLPHTRRREAVLTLERGTVVLLYTDGLVERRGQSLEVGLDRLQHALQDIVSQAPGSGPGLDALCDELLARLLPPVPEDDVALVAVRLREPRASAGAAGLGRRDGAAATAPGAGPA